MMSSLEGLRLKQPVAVCSDHTLVELMILRNVDPAKIKEQSQDPEFWKSKIPAAQRISGRDPLKNYP